MADPIDFSSLKVLVVDDEPFMANLIVRLLQEIGVQDTTTASDGLEGISMIANAETIPDLILCDLEMPEIDGFEFVRMLRAAKSEAKRNIPVVIITGHSESQNVHSAVELGIHGFLAKPVSQGALEKRIASALKNGPIDAGRLRK